MLLRGPRFGILLAACCLAANGSILAQGGDVPSQENIDPADDGSRFAYGENLGWLNGDPSGTPRPGMRVGDLRLGGYLWSENAGWINLTCDNRQTCATHAYGVVNDGHGVLSGYAWGENIGWINFAPAGGGVMIDPATGIFSGMAWGENVGWIAFGSAGPVPYAMRAGCPDSDGDGVPLENFLCPSGGTRDCDDADGGIWSTPGEVQSLLLAADALTLSWSAPALPGGIALAYDTLRSANAADYVAASICVESTDGGDLQAVDPGSPVAGAAFFYLIRAVNGCPGTLGHGSLGTTSSGAVRTARDCP